MIRRDVLTMIGGAAAVACGVRAARAAEPMRIAVPALDATGLVLYANDQGFFKNNGLNVDVQTMPNGEAVTLAMAGGAVDVGCSEVVSLILAYRKGVPLTIVAPGGLQTAKSPAGMMFARSDLAATSGKDFNGKTVAVVGLNGFAQYGTANWIDKTGGDSKSVKFVQFAGAQIPVALQDGRVDGAFVPEPFVSVARKVARPVANPMIAIGPHILSSAHFSTTTYARANPEAIKQLQTALRQAAEWANAHQDQTALILEKYAKVTPEMLAAATRSLYATALDPGDVQPIIDVAAKYGNFPTFSATEMLYRA
jgi:NitT/TauT family transport system substrate-binding protein